MCKLHYGTDCCVLRIERENSKRRDVESEDIACTHNIVVSSSKTTNILLSVCTQQHSHILLSTRSYSFIHSHSASHSFYSLFYRTLCLSLIALRVLSHNK